MPRKNSPVNLKPREYFVETHNYSIAEDMAFDELNFEVDRKFISYYYRGDTVMMKINIIRQVEN